MRKTHEIIYQQYYGITQSEVAWLLAKCAICAFTHPNQYDLLLTLIVSHSCLNWVQIDLMDFRLQTDGEYK